MSESLPDTIDDVEPRTGLTRALSIVEDAYTNRPAFEGAKVHVDPVGYAGFRLSIGDDLALTLDERTLRALHDAIERGLADRVGRAIAETTAGAAG